MNVDHPQKLTHISLCTGYGGIDIGLTRALSGALRTVAYVEIEAFAVENLVAKIEHELLDVAPIWTDLKTFPWSLYREKVDIISGGFPCQPFSGAGRRAGDEDPRHLFPYILDGLRELGRPSLVFLENVEGIISSKLKGDGWNDPEGTPVLLHVLRELERLGYEATAGVFSAREVGAPHQRKRVFIMGVRSDLGESGRDTVSGMLERDAQHASFSADVGEPHGRYCESTERRSAERWSGSVQITKSSTAYPAPRGAEQYAWEPPRVTRRTGPNDTREAQAQSPMGRDADGAPGGLGYAKLCRSVDSRPDELRLLGNGVVPGTAARAFRELWRSLGHASRFSER
jgi:DNA (cytosine-5)-methyltransferase 1